MLGGHDVSDLPLVTVIIPCYNHGRYLSSSIASVLAQDYPRIELIVVNDGSQDDSLEVMRNLQASHGFLVIDQPNGGVTVASEAGCKVASGEYVVIFDADDVMPPYRISKQVDFLKRNPNVGCCGGNFVYIDSNGREIAGAPVKSFGVYGFHELFSVEDLWVGGPTSMYRRKAMLEIGGFDLSLDIQDLQMELKIAHAGYDVAILGDMLSYYRRHSENKSSKYKENFYICLRLIDAYRQESGYRLAYQALVNSALKRAVKEDLVFAAALFRMLPLRDWNRKTFKRFRKYVWVSCASRLTGRRSA